MITNPKLYIYTIKIEKQKIVSVLSIDDNANYFKYPVTEKGKIKIYLIGKNKSIHDVDITTQSIRSRLRYGVNPNHRTGYHGYQWLREEGKHIIVVWVFSSDDNENREFYETVEAEIVYLLRACYGQWPKYQTEIHFYRTNSKIKSLAAKIWQKSKEEIIKFK